jgi:DNA-directed RNA polymerase specialized sigma24 family protein
MSSAERLPDENILTDNELALAEEQTFDAPTEESDAAVIPLRPIENFVEIFVDVPLEDATGLASDTENTPPSFLPGNTAGEVLEKLPRAEFEKIYSALLRHARSRGGHTSKADPEDLVAEALLAFVQKGEGAAQSFRNTYALGGYLMRTLQHKVADHHRRHFRTPEDPTEDVNVLDLDTAADEAVIDSVVFHGILQALADRANLPEYKRELLLEAAFPGKNKGELAAEAGIGESAMRIRFYRLRNELAGILPELLEQQAGFVVTPTEIAERSLRRTPRKQRSRK